MQESFGYLMGILAAFGVTLLIAFPDHLTPEVKPKKKRFSGRHWGGYQDAPAMDDTPSRDEGIEVGMPARKIRHVAGGSTYAGGRGIK